MMQNQKHQLCSNEHETNKNDQGKMEITWLCDVPY